MAQYLSMCSALAVFDSEEDTVISVREAEQHSQARCNRCSLTTVGLERKGPSKIVTAHNHLAPDCHFLSNRMRVAQELFLLLEII